MQTISELVAQADGPGLTAYLAGLSAQELEGLERDLRSALVHVDQERARRAVTPAP